MTDKAIAVAMDATSPVAFAASETGAGGIGQVYFQTAN